MSRQPRIFIKVDFPEPEGPIIATNSFLLMVRLTSLKSLNLLLAEFVEVLVRLTARIRSWSLGVIGHAIFSPI